MRQFFVSVACIAALMLSGCGGGSSSAINGSWSATLTNTDGTTFLVLGVSLNSNSSGAVTVSNISFSTASSCFASGTTGTGSFTSTGTTSGVTTGNFQMTLQSGASNANGTNQLTLEGTLTNSAVTGTWNLTGTGSGCTGSGNFTMGPA